MLICSTLLFDSINTYTQQPFNWPIKELELYSSRKYKSKSLWLIHIFYVTLYILLGLLGSVDITCEASLCFCITKSSLYAWSMHQIQQLLVNIKFESLSKRHRWPNAKRNWEEANQCREDDLWMRIWREGVLCPLRKKAMAMRSAHAHSTQLWFLEHSAMALHVALTPLAPEKRWQKTSTDWNLRLHNLRLTI